VLLNNFVRGAVSGLGFVNVVAALAELAEAFRRRPDALPDDTTEVSDRHAS
jgi:hypothetical protein